MKTFIQQNRKLIVHEPRVTPALTSLLDGNDDFVVMMPAYLELDISEALKIAEELVELGCKEVCFAGTVASKWEDELDRVVECKGRTDVVTTSFLDEAEAAEYFLFAANGARSNLLLALVEGYPQITERLGRLTTSWKEA